MKIKGFDKSLCCRGMQYISGLIYFDKKNERNVLTKKRYFSKIENALADITERMIKDELQEKDYSLE